MTYSPTLEHRQGVSKDTTRPELFLHNFATAPTPPATLPLSWNQTGGLTTQIGMLGNDRYGDCVPAAKFHGDDFKALVSFENGQITWEPGYRQPHQEFVEDYYFDYERACEGATGKRPDLGSDPGTFAPYVVKTGRAEFCASVDLSNGGTRLQAIRQAAIDFRGGLLCVSLTDNDQGDCQQTPWTPWGTQTPVIPDPQEGHGIWYCGYDPEFNYVATWGDIQKATDEWVTECATSFWVFGTKFDAQVAGYDFTAWEQVAQGLPDFQGA